MHRDKLEVKQVVSYQHSVWLIGSCSLVALAVAALAASGGCGAVGRGLTQGPYSLLTSSAAYRNGATSQQQTNRPASRLFCLP